MIISVFLKRNDLPQNKVSFYWRKTSKTLFLVKLFLGVVASVCTPLPTHTQQLSTLFAQQCLESLRPLARSLRLLPKVQPLTPLRLNVDRLLTSIKRLPNSSRGEADSKYKTKTQGKSLIFLFLSKIELRTYFVYFHTFSYKLKV